MQVSHRAQSMQEPMIPVVGDLIRRTPGCISLGQGVVYWGPPPQALEMIPRFLHDPLNHRYQPVAGIPSLLELIKEKLKTENGIRLEGTDVIVTAGGNMAFTHAVKAVADPGDEIILQAPFYFNHEMAVAMAGCRPIIVPTDPDFQLQPELVAAAITPRTRAVVTISPNNPSGAVYPESALREVSELCRERGIYHIHDEAYEYFTFDGAAHFSPASIPASEDHTISLFSLSKAYGFASWRIGYMVVPERLITPIKKIQDTNLICAPVISQFAAVGALTAGRAYCDEMLGETGRVRTLMRAALEEIRDICEVSPSQGAFYFLLKLRSNLPDMEIVKRLITEYGIGIMPGSTFGIDSACCVRVSYGPLRLDTTEEAVGRLVRGLKGILKP